MIIIMPGRIYRKNSPLIRRGAVPPRAYYRPICVAQRKKPAYRSEAGGKTGFPRGETRRSRDRGSHAPKLYEQMIRGYIGQIARNIFIDDRPCTRLPGDGCRRVSSGVAAMSRYGPSAEWRRHASHMRKPPYGGFLMCGDRAGARRRRIDACSRNPAAPTCAPRLKAGRARGLSCRSGAR